MFSSEILERVAIYTEEPDAVIDPDSAESIEDFNSLKSYLHEAQCSPKNNSLNVELCKSFVEDLEASMRDSGHTKGSLYRAVLKFYVDSGLAIPVDVQAFKEGREWCSGGLKGATWFIFNKVRYQSM